MARPTNIVITTMVPIVIGSCMIGYAGVFEMFLGGDYCTFGGIMVQLNWQELLQQISLFDCNPIFGNIDPYSQSKLLLHDLPCFFVIGRGLGFGGGGGSSQFCDL